MRDAHRGDLHQHHPKASAATIRRDMIEMARSVIGAPPDNKTIYHINPTGRACARGPAADTGLTGRKIIVDTYGGWAATGRGLLGKDPTRSTAPPPTPPAGWPRTSSRGTGPPRRDQLTYAIGVAEPLSIRVDCLRHRGSFPTPGWRNWSGEFPADAASHHRDVEPPPAHLATASFGHFGRSLPNFTWGGPTRPRPLGRPPGLGFRPQGRSGLAPGRKHDERHRHAKKGPGFRHRRSPLATPVRPASSGPRPRCRFSAWSASASRRSLQGGPRISACLHHDRDGEPS